MDLIERQSAIDALARTAREKFNLSDEFNHYLAGLMDGETAIRQLPSAQPEVLACGEGELSAQPEPQWISCSECMYWRDERVLMNDGKARQYNGDEPDALGIKHSVPIDVGINQGAMCLYEEGRGWSTDHTTFRNADDFCSRAIERPCSYEEWYGIVDGVYAEPWRGEEHETD